MNMLIAQGRHNLLDKLGQCTSGYELAPCRPDDELGPKYPQYAPFQISVGVLNVALTVWWEIQVDSGPNAQTERQET